MTVRSIFSFILCVTLLALAAPGAEAQGLRDLLNKGKKAVEDEAQKAAQRPLPPWAKKKPEAAAAAATASDDPADVYGRWRGNLRNKKSSGHVLFFCQPRCPGVA